MGKVIIHRPSYVHGSARIGNGTKIGAFCDIGKNVVIGDNCNIQAHCTISNECKIGDGVFIGPNTSLLNDKQFDGVMKPVVVHDFVKIGGGCVILPGVHLGTRCKIGAGSVVTKNVPPLSVVYGIPAKIKKVIK